MTDIFDNTILCRKCEHKMQKAQFEKNGFLLRALVCPKCNDKIIHPVDEEEYQEFMRLKEKEFNVKMRMVGNSYTVSIPREIVDFMHEQEKIMNNMVKLCFEESGRISMNFNRENSRVVKAREVRIMKNNKPVVHAREFYDSANPERNKKVIFRNKLMEKKDE